MDRFYTATVEMANLFVQTGNNSSYVPRLPNALPSAFGKHRVLVWGGDKQTGDTNTSITVMLPEPMSQVVYAEWVTCSIPGYCFQIQQFPNAGRTSAHSGYTSYWRFIGSLTNATNYLTAPFSDSVWAPRSINQLTVNVFNPDGSTPTLANANWMLEIDVWYITER